jgi:hypothetical protein
MYCESVLPIGFPRGERTYVPTPRGREDRGPASAERLSQLSHDGRGRPGDTPPPPGSRAVAMLSERAGVPSDPGPFRKKRFREERGR